MVASTTHPSSALKSWKEGEGRGQGGAEQASYNEGL